MSFLYYGHYGTSAIDSIMKHNTSPSLSRMEQLFFVDTLTLQGIKEHEASAVAYHFRTPASKGCNTKKIVSSIFCRYNNLLKN
jgi:hypothetical protein